MTAPRRTAQVAALTYPETKESARRDAAAKGKTLSAMIAEALERQYGVPEGKETRTEEETP